MNKILYLIRGVSGSGKTTFANTLGCVVFSADNYFTDSKTGEYNFTLENLKYAHEWCQEKTETAMRFAKTIAVANTFTKEWEMKPYFDLAEKNGFTVFSIIVENRHGNKNIHNVPDHAIENQTNRFEVKL